MSIKHHRFGVLTPSSNTSLEPLTSAIVSEIPGTTAHFSRFRVTEITLEKQASDQFAQENIMAAANLLTDCRADVIGWSGTSSSWLGFEKDAELCQKIEAQTGIPATTSILALNELLSRFGHHSFGLVTPYTAQVQDRILSNYSAAGFNIVAEDHLGISENFAFSEISEATLTAQVRKVAEQGAPVIVVACTNLRAAGLVSRWEAEFGIPVLDTTITVIWKMLQMTGQEPAMSGWGRLMTGEMIHG
ncbi:MAG: maleate isomerase [Oleiphilaceae bacterium]|jgi:maleate isomerase